MTTFLGVFLVAFVVATGLTPLASSLAYRIGAIDVPGGRKVHERTTPRLGGLAVLGGFLAGLSAGVWWSPGIARQVDPAFGGVLVGALVIVVLGIWDDAKGLSAWTKFPVQLLAAHVAWMGGVKFVLLTNALTVFGQGAPPYVLGEGLSYLATILWIVGVTNAMNFIDGLDALASGLAFIISTTLLVVALQLDQVFFATVYASLMGGVFGFGRYNQYPARIFLGDTGSTFLGFTLACTATLANHKATALGGLFIPVVALGVPVADTFYAMFRRFVGGKSMFQADRGHIHHRLLAMGYTPKEAVWVIYLLAIALSVGVFFLVHAKNDFAALVIVLLTAGAFTMARKLELLHLDRFEEPAAAPPAAPGDGAPSPPQGPGPGEGPGGPLP